ncbi:MAG: DUF4368 domain-containing protein [Clostridiales bacterium]|nr:DUF4368 domain-containing protein [Clostridiales bacterium]
MEIRVLEYFIGIAREGNMSRAAEKLPVSPPSLSKQMKTLEQEQLQIEIGVLEYRGKTQEDINSSYDQFKALTEKYVDVTELTPMMVNEYIEEIVIYAPDRSSGYRQQKIQIIFNFVDEVDIPAIAEPIVYERLKNTKKRRDLRVTPPLLPKVPYRLQRTLQYISWPVGFCP